MTDQLRQIGERIAALREIEEIDVKTMAARCEMTEEDYILYEEGKKDFMLFIQIFGRNGGVNSEFHTQPSNLSSGNGTIVTPESIFINGVSVSEIYEMMEDEQDAYCEQIIEKVTPFKGKINARWYRGSIQMTPPHHCEE